MSLHDVKQIGISDPSGCREFHKVHHFSNIFRYIEIEPCNALWDHDQLACGSVMYFGTRCASGYVNSFYQSVLQR